MDERPRKPNWRHGYHEQIEAWREQLWTFRRNHSDKVYEVKGRNRRAYELTDDQIRELARDLAEKDIQHAINEWNCREVDNRRRRRSGIGL